LTTLAVKHCQIALAKPLRVAEEVDLGNLSAPDCEGHDREQLSFEHADQPRGAIDEDRAPEHPESRERDKTSGVCPTGCRLRSGALDRRFPRSPRRDAERDVLGMGAHRHAMLFQSLAGILRRRCAACIRVSTTGGSTSKTRTSVSASGAPQRHGEAAQTA